MARSVEWRTALERWLRPFLAVLTPPLSAPFRQGFSEHGLFWAVGIPRQQKVDPADVQLIYPVTGQGQPRQRHIPDTLSAAVETALAEAIGGRSAGAAAARAG